MVGRREAHADDTRRALLAAARRVFARRGYKATSLDDIAERARLTKGALYHHFDSKAALLEAVYVEIEGELAARVVAAMTTAGDDAWATMLAALDAFFAASTEPEYIQIVLRDAPHVLGKRHGREIDQAIGLGLVVELVTQLIARGLFRPLPITPTARVLLAAASEVAISIAEAAEPEVARREGMAVILALVEGLRPVA
jgi:AcrR family transcriptional regulator